MSDLRQQIIAAIDREMCVKALRQHTLLEEAGFAADEIVKIVETELTRLRSLVDQSGGGEPVALAHIEEADTYPYIRLQILDGEYLQPSMSPVKLFASPPHGGRILEGWRMVPVEPTLEMQRAYFDVIDRNMKRVQTDAAFGRFSSNREAYQAMLSAAPVSPLREGADG